MFAGAKRACFGMSGAFVGVAENGGAKIDYSAAG